MLDNADPPDPPDAFGALIQTGSRESIARTVAAGALQDYPPATRALAHLPKLLMLCQTCGAGFAGLGPITRFRTFWVRPPKLNGVMASFL